MNLSSLGSNITLSSSTPILSTSSPLVATDSTADLAMNAAQTLTINGFGFNPTAADNFVTFTTTGAVGTVTAATPSSLTVRLSTAPLLTGPLKAAVEDSLAAPPSSRSPPLSRHSR